MQIGDCIVVHIVAEVLLRRIESRPDAMVEVEHRSHAIEAEAVEVEILHPIAHIREQELQRLLLAVVEQFGVPKVVVAALACMKILEISAVKEVDALADVFHRVGMNEVHDDQQAHAVRCVNQLHQILGRTETRTRREEIGDMVAKRAVIRMLGDGHELDGVVAVRLDARQDVLGEFLVGTYPFGLLRHAHVRLVNQQRLAVQLRRGVLIYIRCGRIPELAVIVLGAFVLNHALDIHGNALMLPDLRLHHDLQLAAMREPMGKLAVGQEDFPDAVADVLQRAFVAVPAVELTHQREVMRSGRPFAIPPAVATLVVVEAQELVRRGESPEATVTIDNIVKPPFVAVVAVVHRLRDWIEPGVVIYEREHNIVI